MAERVQREAGADVRAQISLAWRLAYAAEPTEVEAKEALAFLTAQTEQFRSRPSPSAEKTPEPAPALRALTSFCQALLSSNRFLYVN